MVGNAPRYVSPKELAENRARWLRFAYWVAVTVPATIALMMFGYNDQAPGWLREATVGLDSTIGFPVLRHRADDFPAYLVIVIVGHILVPIVLVVETEIAPAIWVSMTLWPLIALAMALCLLQPVKGAVVATQWYGGMHGFEEAKKAARSQRPPRASSPETQSRIWPRSL